MRIFTKAAAGALLVVATTFPTAAIAGAETYTNPDTPNVGSHDDHQPGTVDDSNTDTPRGEEGGEVLGESSENPSAEEGTSSPGGAGGAVLPATAEAPAAAAAETAPSGSLPFTGGDVVGMTIIGLGAVGLGTVLVRRSRKDGAQTA
jgi:hypothetical protein